MGFVNDPFLLLLSQNSKQENCIKAFLQFCYYHALWSTIGDFPGNCPKSMVETILRQAAGQLPGFDILGVRVVIKKQP